MCHDSCHDLQECASPTPEVSSRARCRLIWKTMLCYAMLCYAMLCYAAAALPASFFARNQHQLWCVQFASNASLLPVCDSPLPCPTSRSADGEQRRQRGRSDALGSANAERAARGWLRLAPQRVRRRYSKSYIPQACALRSALELDRAAVPQPPTCDQLDWNRGRCKSERARKMRPTQLPRRSHDGAGGFASAG
jgi:hypothetical protein